MAAALLLATAAACGGAATPEVDGARDPGRAATLRFWEAFRRAGDLRLDESYSAAAAAYREALSIDPDHEDSLYYLGHCERELGEFGAAAETWRRLLQVNPRSARGHMALAALLASPEEEAPLDLLAAEEHLRRAHDINAEETGPLVRLGEVLIVLGRPAEAEFWLESAAATNHRSVEAAFLAGYLRWEAGDRAGARSYYARAVQATRREKPVQGVLGEGDRRDPAGGRAAAPPLEETFGRTLFGDLVAQLRNAPSDEPVTADDTGLDALYRPVRELADVIAARAEVRAPH